MTNENKNFTKITAQIDKDLYTKFKVQVVVEGSTIKDTLEELIREYLVKKGQFKKEDRLDE